MKAVRKMSDYPKDWEVHKVSDFGNVVTGNTPSTSIKEYWNGNYTWITPTDIESQIFMNVSERKLTLSGYNKSRKLRKGAVLVTCIASIGKNCILDVDGSCNQQINAIEVNKKSYNLYIYYLMEFNKKTLENLAGITATKILKKDTFEKIEFTIPPLEEQKAIADTLMIFDKHIENLEKLIEKKKMIRDGAVEDLMTGKTRLYGFDGEWEKVTIFDLMSPYGGLSGKSSKDFKDGNKKYISYLKVFNNLYIEKVDTKVIIKKNEMQNAVNKGDIIFTQSSETLDEVGMASTYLGEEEVYLNSFCFGTRKKREFNSVFMVLLLRSEEIRKKISTEGQGSTRYNLSPNRLMNIELLIPSLKEQEAIADILTSMDEEIENLEKEKTKIEKIRAGAMDDLLTGKVRLV